MNKKKLAQPEHPASSSQAEQSLPNVPAQPPEVASRKAAEMPVPEAPNGPVPASERDWRSHIFFFWLGIIGTVGTLIGVFLSVYFYQASLIKPLLTFAVHPLKTELQRPDYDKELGFIYKGNPLDSESITSVQVSIWNAGTRSIRDSDVLDPLRVVMPDGSPILSVRAKKTSRPICGFESLGNQEDYKSGTCPLKWRILEPGDGAVLQIIYAGSARRDPKLEGTVEGQRDGIAVEQYSLNFRGDGIEASISVRRVLWPIIVLISGVCLVLIAVRIQSKTEAGKKLAHEKAAAAKYLAELHKRTIPAPPLALIMLAVGLVCVLAAVAVLIFSSPHGPPFGW